MDEIMKARNKQINFISQEMGIDEYTVQQVLCGNDSYEEYLLEERCTNCRFSKNGQCEGQCSAGKIRVIKVQETDMMGYSGDTKYFTSLKKAKKYFKKLFNRNKADLVSADEGYGEKPVSSAFKSTERLKGRRYREACLECLTENTSENGTEYDTEIITISLEEIKIES